MRWSRGHMQVFARYGGRLLRGLLHGSFSCYDMAMSIMPAAILTGLSIVVNIGAAIANLGGDWASLGAAGWQPIVHTRTMESTEVQDMKKTQKISA